MTQSELERQVAAVTGESRQTVRNRGFSLLEIPCPPPLMIDWDELDAFRTSYLPDRQHACPQLV